MKNGFNTTTNYYNDIKNKFLLNKKTYGVIKTEPNYYNSEVPKNHLKYLSINEEFDNILSKALSKKKGRGILDMATPGNKDVLTDSDSECPPSRRSKNNGIINKKIPKKNKCTKLIIEKVESQEPKINEEYYKFTNLKKKWNK